MLNLRDPYISEIIDVYDKFIGVISLNGKNLFEIDNLKLSYDGNTKSGTFNISLDKYILLESFQAYHIIIKYNKFIYHINNVFIKNIEIHDYLNINIIDFIYENYTT